MITANKPQPLWSKRDAAQANLEISYSHLRHVLAPLCRNFIPGRFPFLYYQYRFNDGTGAVGADCGAGMGVYS